MLDRKKLAAPVFAQAAAFIAVLLIGGFTSHGSPKPATTSTPTPTHPTASVPGTSTSGAAAGSKGPSFKLIVRVTEDAPDGVPGSGTQVEVLSAETLASVASSGPVNPPAQYVATVTAGRYDVCIQQPTGWVTTVPTTHVQPGLDCFVVDTRKGLKPVTFHLTLQTSAPQTSQLPQIPGQVG